MLYTYYWIVSSFLPLLPHLPSTPCEDGIGHSLWSHHLVRRRTGDYHPCPCSPQRERQDTEDHLCHPPHPVSIPAGDILPLSQIETGWPIETEPVQLALIWIQFTYVFYGHLGAKGFSVASMFACMPGGHVLTSLSRWGMLKNDARFNPVKNGYLEMFLEAKVTHIFTTSPIECWF